MANRVSLCSKSYCWICSSAVCCHASHSYLERPRWRECPCWDLCCPPAGWLNQRMLLGRSSLVCVGQGQLRAEPACPSPAEGSGTSLQFAKPGVLQSSHGCTHTGSAGLLMWHFIFHLLWKLDLWLLGKPLLSHVSVWKNKLPTFCYVTPG